MDSTNGTETKTLNDNRQMAIDLTNGTELVKETETLKMATDKWNGIGKRNRNSN